MAIRVETESESGCSREPAVVKVYDGDTLVATVTAKVKGEQGADGGYYPCVKFDPVTMHQSEPAGASAA